MPSAFSIASKFTRLGPQRAAIKRAQAARLSPGLYRQLGRDPAAIIEEGKAALRERFGAMQRWVPLPRGGGLLCVAATLE